MADSVLSLTGLLHCRPSTLCVTSSTFGCHLLSVTHLPHLAVMYSMTHPHTFGCHVFYDISPTFGCHVLYDTSPTFGCHVLCDISPTFGCHVLCDTYPYFWLSCILWHIPHFWLSCILWHISHFWLSCTLWHIPHFWLSCTFCVIHTQLPYFMFWVSGQIIYKHYWYITVYSHALTHALSYFTLKLEQNNLSAGIQISAYFKPCYIALSLSFQ